MPGDLQKPILGKFMVAMFFIAILFGIYFQVMYSWGDAISQNVTGLNNPQNLENERGFNNTIHSLSKIKNSSQELEASFTDKSIERSSIGGLIYTGAGSALTIMKDAQLVFFGIVRDISTFVGIPNWILIGIVSLGIFLIIYKIMSALTLGGVEP